MFEIEKFKIKIITDETVLTLDATPIPVPLGDWLACIKLVEDYYEDEEMDNR